MASDKKTPPRIVPVRDEKYMGLALWMASFSKDPKTQVGSVIINNKNQSLGWGYNGPPRDISDTDIDWSRPEKYAVIIHAERNAIRHSVGDLAGATLYVTARPCKACMLDIVDSGIKRVVYLDLKPCDKSSLLASKKDNEKAEEIARLGGVTLIKFSGNLNWMRDRIKVMYDLGVFG